MSNQQVIKIDASTADETYLVNLEDVNDPNEFDNVTEQPDSELIAELVDYFGAEVIVLAANGDLYMSDRNNGSHMKWKRKFTKAEAIAEMSNIGQII